jgi:hypothetical protein
VSIFRRRKAVMPGLTCEQVAEVLQSYLDEELDDHELSRRVSAHLDDCRRCGIEADTYATIKASLARRADPVDAERLARLRAFGEGLSADAPHPNQDPYDDTPDDWGNQSNGPGNPG